MSNTMKIVLALSLTFWSFCCTLPALAKYTINDLPAFKVRLRVVSVAGKAPEGKTFLLVIAKKTVQKFTGDDWSEWTTCGQEQLARLMANSQNVHSKGYPFVGFLSLSGVEDTTAVEGEFCVDANETVVPFKAELYGPLLGFLIWRDKENVPHIATMAQYNQRYWDLINTMPASGGSPKLLPIVDRFIGSDNDRICWRQALENLSRIGFNSLTLPPQAAIRDIQTKAGGIMNNAGAIYTPPNGPLGAFNADVTPEKITAWAQSLAKPYFDAGYAPRQIVTYKIADEPGWYYPNAFELLQNNPQALARFRQYLASQGLTPNDVGAETWDTVLPIARTKAIDLPSRRLFYWSTRFVSWDSSRYYAEATRAMEKAFSPNTLFYANMNFFSGRLYVPGPVAHNRAKTSPDAAMGGHDWLELGRMRGGNAMWTEDWFGDQLAYQWSFYAAKMRSAAEKSDMTFGGYVIPGASGQREDGILQKILCLVGSGGKAVKEYNFGPNYNFPGNCYSEKLAVLPKMAEAHGMIAKAEELLWPGKRPKPQVAILHPRSAELWDAKQVPIPTMIKDATNTNLNRATVDYMAEVYDLYLALQHADIPVDFVEEDDLSPKGLHAYKVLYITEPNIPEEFQQGLLAWVRDGGVLVTVSNAATADRYDDPCTVVANGLGLAEQPRERMLIADPETVAESGKGDGKFGAFTAYGPRGTWATIPTDGVLATFADNVPALVEKAIGKGKVFYFPWMPGFSYFRSKTGIKDLLPVGFSESLRAMITYPVRIANVQVPVSVDCPMIETPLLLSDKGGAVTLLNWTGEAKDKVTLTVNLPFTVKSVESIKQGKLRYTRTETGVIVSLPLKAADILLLRP